MGKYFIKYLKFLLFSVISFTFLFSIVKTNFSSEKSTSIYQIQDTTACLRLKGLGYGIKNHITKTWTSNGSDYMILAGGRTYNSISNLVTLIQIQSQLSLQLPSLPFPIEKAGGFIIKDSLYVVGGSSDSVTNGISKSVFKLNLKNPTSWEQKGDMPIELSEITFGTMALNDSVAYVAGGMKIDGNESDYCFIYYAKTDEWKKISNMPYKAYGASLGVVNDSVLILIGGRTSDSVYNKIYRGVIKHNNPEQITWSLLQSYPPGQVYDIGCWGTKIGFTIFSGGTNSLHPGNSSDTVYRSVYAYIESNHSLKFVTIKPSPVTHTQLDGFIIPGPNITLRCITAGGSKTPWGEGVADVETTNIKLIDLLILTGIHENNTPDKMILYQNYPNPFNPVTNIKFDIPKNTFVTLKVFDMLGREVATLVNEYMHSGSYQADWNASAYPSGVYFYKLQIESQDRSSESYTEVKKMLLVK